MSIPSRRQAPRIVSPSNTRTDRPSISSSIIRRGASELAHENTPSRPIADSIALDAVWPRPQIEASRMHWPTSAITASSFCDAADRPARDEAGERLLLAHGADAAGHALPARLVAEERGQPHQQPRQVDRLVEHHHDARAERRLRFACALERERQVELVGPQEAARRAAHEDALQLLAPGRRRPASSSSSRSVVPNGTS